MYKNGNYITVLVIKRHAKFSGKKETKVKFLLLGLGRYSLLGDLNLFLRKSTISTEQSIY